MKLFKAVALTFIASVVGAQGLHAESNNTMSVFEKLAQDPYLQRLTRPENEGWLAIPGTQTDIKFGGFIQLNVLHDFQNAGYPYGWFVPINISVPTDHTGNTEFDARASRFNIQTRTNTKDVGYVSTTMEIDFYSDNIDGTPNPRFRQAYVTWVGPQSNIAFSAGQTWSTFSDLLAWPDIADNQGPVSMTGGRMSLIRGSYAFGEKKDVVVDLSIEQPDSFVQEAEGNTEWPNVAGRINWLQSWGHLQGMFLVRDIKAESVATGNSDSDMGYGLSLSGSWNIPGTQRDTTVKDNLGARQDSMQFQVQGGSGMGRYVMDLATGIYGENTRMDGIYDDASNKLELFDEFGWFVTYRHWWTDYLRSTAIYAVEKVDNIAIQNGDAYHKTDYVLANLAYRAFDRMDVAVEYTWGKRENKDEQTGEANRINFVINYGF